jgi:hypothetical protein
VNSFIDVGAGAGVAAGAAGRPGNAAADFLGQGAGAAQLPAAGGLNHPGAAAAAVARPGGVGVAGAAAVARPGGVERPAAALAVANNRPGRVENRDQRQGDRTARQGEVRNQFNEHNPGDFWSNNPLFATWAITRPFAWATWGSASDWCGYTEEAIPYAYGENVYYQDDQVYAGDQPVATAEEYAAQAEAIAASTPTAAAEKGEWLPLGVFAITQDGQATGPEPTLYLQLTLSKQAVIAGTLKNTATGKVETVEGMADKKSQRVAWTIAGQQRPVMETGLANLTTDTSPALIHFADGQTQQVLMVRLPEDAQAAAPAQPKQ